LAGFFVTSGRSLQSLNPAFFYIFDQLTFLAVLGLA